MWNHPPRIAIDARYLSHGLLGGVHTYTRNLITALLALDCGQRYSLWADTKCPFELTDLPASADVKLRPWRGPVTSVANDVRLGTAMARDGAQVIHFPANYGFAPRFVPVVVTLHDAINLLPLHEIIRSHAKNARTITTMTYLHIMTRRSIRRRPHVITVSQYSRQEILKHSRLPADRVHVVPEAHEGMFRVIEPECTRSLAARLGRTDRVLAADAIKNPECVLRAYRRLPASVREDMHLVFFARRTPPSSVVESASRGESTLLLQPSREDLVALFNLACLFVFPSWYEGFGIPVLEAMACGTPVIASSRGALPEVVGEGGIIVDAEDDAAISDAITRLEHDTASYRALRERSMARASGFSWERAACQTREIYEEALRRRAQIPERVKDGAMAQS